MYYAIHCTEQKLIRQLPQPHLYLLHGEVQEGVVVADADQALGPLAAHAGAKAPVQLQHHQLVEAGADALRPALGFDLLVGQDLGEGDRGGPVTKRVSLGLMTAGS